MPYPWVATFRSSVPMLSAMYAGCAEAAAYGHISRAARLLTEYERQRTVATKAPFLMQDRNIVPTEGVLETIPSRVAIESRDP
jgi:hypothetical protein